MATSEDELKELREKNNELVQKVQYWKMTAAQREDEKLGLMKEINELRLTLSRIRSSGNVQAQQLDTELQEASEKALAHLVRASGEIAKTIEITKKYIRNRQEADVSNARWSTLSGTPTPVKTDKIHRVRPMIVGGQSIQPVVSLSRTLLNTSNPRSTTRSPNQNVNTTQRAVPMHMLQDVYIPLTRIDVDLPNNSMETESEPNNNDDSSEDLGLDDSGEQLDESQRMSEDEDYETSRRLDAVAEDIEPEEEATPPRPRSRPDPLEGPSWLLDTPADKNRKTRTTLEPDSTTELDENTTSTIDKSLIELGMRSVRVSCEYSPTVRRRKRTSSPPAHSPHLPHLPRSPHVHCSPRNSHSRRNSTSGRVLKVLVAKMSLEGGGAGGGGGGVGGAVGGAGESGESPAKRSAAHALDAPSPHGATVPGVIVSETTETDNDNGSGEPAPAQRTRPSTAGTERDSHTSRGTCERDSTHNDSEFNSSRRGNVGGARGTGGDSDSSGDRISEGRSRRNRKVVTYKEKPLNRKLRR